MLTRFEDFDRSFSAFSQLRRLFDEVESAPAASRKGGERMWTGGFPRASFQETANSIVLTADVPGLGEKSVDLSVHEDVLTLRGERQDDAPQGRYVHRRERSPVRFSRSFALPCRVDPETSTATIKNGVLTVTLAKAVEARPRAIAVKAQ